MGNHEQEQHMHVILIGGGLLLHPGYALAPPTSFSQLVLHLHTHKLVAHQTGSQVGPT